jgi:hypothetical protein
MALDRPIVCSWPNKSPIHPIHSVFTIVFANTTQERGSYLGRLDSSCSASQYLFFHYFVISTRIFLGNLCRSTVMAIKCVQRYTSYDCTRANYSLPTDLPRHLHESGVFKVLKIPWPHSCLVSRTSWKFIAQRLSMWRIPIFCQR